MEEEKIPRDSTEYLEAKGGGASGEMETSGGSRSEECRCGPGWKGWALSILAAILLSVTATLLLGGYGSFRSDRAAAPGASGTGSNCCPPADAGK